jgi:hypothetical protein
VVCLQETKKCHFDIEFIKSCCPRRFDDFVYIPSTGASGGLIIIWDSSVFSGMIMHCEPLVNIYGPCDGDLRDSFIQWLFQLNIPSEEDWLIVGDFNFIGSLANRNKPGGNVNDMLIFNDFIRSQI